MTIITDPTFLLASNSDASSTPGAELTIDTAAKTIKLNPGQGDIPLSTDGVTFQTLYSAFKILWKNSDTYIKYPFPFEAITTEQFEVIKGWSFLDTTTRKAIRNAGWAEKSLTDKTIAIYSGIITLGDIDSTETAYYLNGGSITNFTFNGPVNEPILVYSDPLGDGSLTGGFDNRSSLKVYIRNYGKTYSYSDIANIGVSRLSSMVYRFPLYDAVDTKISHNDAYIIAHPEIYENITISFYSSPQEFEINGSPYHFNVVIDADNKDYQYVYEKVQYLLRQNSNINQQTTPNTIGKTTTNLLKFVGSTLYTEIGVFITNININNRNQIIFTEIDNYEVSYPFIATGTIVFNTNLVDDSSGVYKMFFLSCPDGDFGGPNAIVVHDNDGNPIAGSVSGNTITFSFDYDNNNQGGRTPATDAQVVLVGIGLEKGVYTSSQSTITRSTGQTIQLISPLERNYENAV